MENNKQFTCEFCNKKFKAKFELNRHMKGKRCQEIQHKINEAKKILGPTINIDKTQTEELIFNSFDPDKFTLEHYKLQENGLAKYIQECFTSNNIQVTVNDSSRRLITINNMKIKADKIILTMIKKLSVTFGLCRYKLEQITNDELKSIKYTKIIKADHTLKMEFDQYNLDLANYNYINNNIDDLKKQFIYNLKCELLRQKYYEENDDFNYQHYLCDPDMYHDKELSEIVLKKWVRHKCNYLSPILPFKPDTYHWIDKDNYDKNEYAKKEKKINDFTINFSDNLIAIFNDELDNKLLTDTSKIFIELY